MTDTTNVQADEPKTENIPGRGRGIVLSNGTLLDPVFASVKGLVRAGDDDVGDCGARRLGDEFYFLFEGGQ